METQLSSQRSSQLSPVQPLQPEELIVQTFVSMGYSNENPNDIAIIARLLQYWRTNTTPEVYTPEEYALLNDAEVLEVLQRCKEYYEPKTHLTQSDLKSILEDIALGKLKRTAYDFKSGEYVTEDPSFTDRIAAIRMLQPDSTQDTAETVQFINNIGYGEILPPQSATPQSASDPKAVYIPPDPDSTNTLDEEDTLDE